MIRFERRGRILRGVAQYPVGCQGGGKLGKLERPATPALALPPEGPAQSSVNRRAVQVGFSRRDFFSPELELELRAMANHQAELGH